MVLVDELLERLDDVFCLRLVDRAGEDELILARDVDDLLDPRLRRSDRVACLGILERRERLGRQAEPDGLRLASVGSRPSSACGRLG